MNIIVGESLHGAPITVVSWPFEMRRLAGQGHHQNVGNYVEHSGPCLMALLNVSPQNGSLGLSGQRTSEPP